MVRSLTERETIDLDRTYSAEEFAALPDDGNRYELIEGKLVMSPQTGDEHGTIISELHFAIKAFLKQNKVGKVWITTGFNIGKKPNGKDNVLGPDIGFIVAERVPPTDEGYPPYPDLVAEVWSRKSDLSRPVILKNAQKKLQMFLKAGTRIAWGINPIDKTVEVYHQGQITPVVLTVNDELDGEDVILGFRLKVSELFN
jgi:Uma2 family endonuclease